MAKKTIKTPLPAPSAPQPPTPIPPVERSEYRIMHRTASVPEWAHDELTKLQELIRNNGGIDAVPGWLREFTQGVMGPGNANFTKGLVFGLACKIAIAELEKKS